jgi:hypothetical protein
MAFTETTNHISAQNIMLVTTNNMVYNLIHRMYTARRPLKGGQEMSGEAAPTSYFDAPAAEDEEEDGKDDKNKKKPLKLKSMAYPRYDPVQPLFNTNYVSYDLELSDLRSINTYPTKLESTSQVFVYGHDLFLARVYPDSKFDLLQSDFPFPLIFTGIAALIVLTFVAQKWTKDHGERKNFLMR